MQAPSPALQTLRVRTALSARSLGNKGYPIDLETLAGEVLHDRRPGGDVVQPQADAAPEVAVTWVVKFVSNGVRVADGRKYPDIGELRQGCVDGCPAELRVNQGCPSVDDIRGQMLHRATPERAEDCPALRSYP